MPDKNDRPDDPKRVVGVYDRPKNADGPSLGVKIAIAVVVLAIVVAILYMRHII